MTCGETAWRGKHHELMLRKYDVYEGINVTWEINVEIWKTDHDTRKLRKTYRKHWMARGKYDTSYGKYRSFFCYEETSIVCGQYPRVTRPHGREDRLWCWHRPRCHSFSHTLTILHFPMHQLLSLSNTTLPFLLPISLFLSLPHSSTLLERSPVGVDFLSTVAHPGGPSPGKRN